MRWSLRACSLVACKLQPSLLAFRRNVLRGKERGKTAVVAGKPVPGVQIVERGIKMGERASYTVRGENGGRLVRERGSLPFSLSSLPSFFYFYLSSFFNFFFFLTTVEPPLTATSLRQQFFFLPGQSIHSLLFQPLYNGHFLLSARWPL